MQQTTIQMNPVEQALRSRAAPQPHTFQFSPSLNALYFLMNGGRGGSSLFHTPLANNTNTPAATAADIIKYSPLLSMEALSGGGGQQQRALSKEEILLRERMRMVETGVTSFDFNDAHSTFAVPVSNGGLVVCDVSSTVDGSADHLSMAWEPSTPVEEHPRMYPKLSPDAQLIGFVQNGDIKLRSIKAQTDHVVTTEHVKDANKWAGESKFCVQEEFDRYTAFWWSPVVTSTTTTTEQQQTYDILYLVEDESKVHQFTIASGITGTPDVYRYPLVNTPNTTFEIAVARIQVTTTNGGSSVNVVKTGKVDQSLGGRFPWCEYVVRAGWTADGKKVWLQLLDRVQEHLVLVTVNVDALLVDGRLKDEDVVAVVVDEKNPVWINVTDICYPLAGSDKFIFASERTGYRHLYVVESTSKAARAITAGDERVVSRDNQIWVDETNKLVYFMCTAANNPLQMGLCCASYAEGNDPRAFHQITPTNMDCSSAAVQTSKDGKQVMAVAVLSNCSTPHHTLVYSLSPVDGRVTTTKQLAPPTTQATALFPWHTPEFFNFKSQRHGRVIHGCIYKPHTANSNKKSPVIMDIYGGPHVQQVRDTWLTTARPMRQMWANHGFVVVVIDNVGSDNRGIDFESPIRCAMGTVEIEDQTEALFFLEQRGDVAIDLSRVGINGWSYGGYASLVALATQPEMYKCAIAGAPVTEWRAYDTAYTERYMKLLPEAAQGYNEGSVVLRAADFPAEEGRLLIIHGSEDENVHFAHTVDLVHQLTLLNKPHVLKVIPGQRHGVSNWNQRLHVDTTIFSFLNAALNP